MQNSKCCNLRHHMISRASWPCSSAAVSSCCSGSGSGSGSGSFRCWHVLPPMLLLALALPWHIQDWL